MKRIISLVLTMVLIVACMAVPVMAEETDDYGWIQLMDYGYPSNYGTNFIEPSGPSFSIYYDNVLGGPVPFVDIILRTDSTTFSAGTYSTYLDVISLGGGVFRVFGQAKYLPDSNIVVGFSDYDGSYFELLSFRISSLSISSLPVSYYGYVYDYSYSPIKETYFSGDGSSPMTPVSISPNSGRENFQGFVSRIYVSSWKAYDYISLNISMLSSSFASLKVEMNGISVPYEINTVESTDVLGTSLYLLDVLIDTRNLDRASDSYILVDVSGMVNPTFTGSFTLRSCLGFVSTPSPSLWTHWFTNLQGWLSSGFSSVSASLTTLGNNISSYISSQTSSINSTLTTHMENLIAAEASQQRANRELMNTISSNVNTWISNQTTTITNSLSTINSSIGTFRTNVETWFTNQTTAITNSISSWGQSIIDSINSGADRIVAALSPNGSADDFNDKVQQQGSELENMAGAMGVVTRPDVSTAIPDIGGYLTVSGPVTLASVFDPFWKNSYILRLLLGSLAVSVAFTVVYGGKK